MQIVSDPLGIDLHQGFQTIKHHHLQRKVGLVDSKVLILASINLKH